MPSSKTLIRHQQSDRILAEGVALARLCSWCQLARSRGSLTVCVKASRYIRCSRCARLGLACNAAEVERLYGASASTNFDKSEKEKNNSLLGPGPPTEEGSPHPSRSTAPDAVVLTTPATTVGAPAPGPFAGGGGTVVPGAREASTGPATSGKSRQESQHQYQSLRDEGAGRKKDEMSQPYGMGVQMPPRQMGIQPGIGMQMPAGGSLDPRRRDAIDRWRRGIL